MTTNIQESYTYKVGGSLGFDHPTYVERKADKTLFKALKEGKFCYVFNCRQMGKSSLRVRAMHKLQAQGMRCASVDITSLGSDISQKQWYSAIITQLFLGFNLIGKVNLKVWLREREDLSGIQKFSDFLEEILLVHCPGEKVYIFIDEIDKILSLKFSLDDFFSVIRFFYNQKAENKKFERLVFSLFGVATPTDLIQDKTQTPFNIGFPIELTGFTSEEIEPLAPGLMSISDHPQLVLKAILDWTGGQPFLTQKICDLLLTQSDIIPPKQEKEWVNKIVREFIIENWESHDEPVHLKTIRERIFRNEKRAGRLLGMYQQILQKGFLKSDESPEQTEFRLSGLVVKKNGILVVYNRVYQKVFNQEWVKKELEKIRPYSEMLAAWVDSKYEDDSRLLRGQALKDALTWAMDKSLSNLDYKFLTESQNLDKREAELNLKAQQQVNEILTKANQKAQQMIRLGIGILVVSVVGAAVAFTLAGIAFQKQKEAQVGAKLEGKGESFLKQFEFEQLDSLVLVMEANEKLKNIVKDQRLLEEYPAKGPIATLEQILNLIREKNKLIGHTDEVNSVNFSPDGQWIATASSDETVRLWTRQGQEQAVLTGYQGRIYGVAFSPDSQTLATAGEDKMVRIWDLQGNQLAIFEGHEGWVYRVTFSPDGQRLASASSDRTARIWDTQGKSPIVLKGHTKSVDDVAFSTKGELIATASRDGTVKLWNNQGKLIKTLKDNDSNSQDKDLSFYSVSFSPNDQQIAAGAKDKTIKIWDRQGNLIKTLNGHDDFVNRVVFSRDGQWIVSGSSDRTAILWSRDGEQIDVFKGHQDFIFDVALNNEGTELATASRDGTVKLWAIEKPAPNNGFNALDKDVFSADFSEDGKLLALADENGKVYVWNLQGKKEEKLLEFDLNDSFIKSINIAPNGEMIAATTHNNRTVELWDLQGKKLGELGEELEDYKWNWPIDSITFSSNSQILVIANRSGTVSLWDLQQKPYKLIQEFKAHDAPINHVIFSQDGKKLATASDDKIAKIWDLKGNLKQSFSGEKGHKKSINWLNFSPDNQYLLTASKDGTIKLWNLEGKIITTLNSDLFPISHVNFSPNGEYFVTASQDGTVRLWDRERKLHIKINGHQESLKSVQFTPDNQTILTVDKDGKVRMWPLQSQFTRLNLLLDQGCHWLQDYLSTRPQEQEQLSSCSPQIVPKNP